MIPKKIFQSWKTKNLDQKMKESVSKLRELNPEYQYFLFDDEDCREYILKHFGQNYLNAFDILIPGAFKCDLWRYAVLYVEGGVYLDIDMEALAPFREIIKDDDQLVTVIDRDQLFGSNGIYQAFLAAIPRHPAIKHMLDLAFYNIASRRVGLIDVLNITGPGVAGVSLNLYFGNKDTNTPFSTGKKMGVKLLRVDQKMEYTYDLNDRKVFKNKLEGYERLINYRFIESYYKDDPLLKFKRIFLLICLAIIIIALLGLIFSFVFRRKWKHCERTCSVGSLRN